MSDLEQYVSQLVANAQKASTQLAVTGSAVKDAFLLKAAEEIVARAGMLKVENAKDIEAAEAAGISPAMIDRLRLTDDRIEGMADGLRTVANLADPVGLGLGAWKRPNGIDIRKVSVPIGVIMMIFESRPNVTADAGALCLKSGNAVILRGGKEAIHSNLAIHQILAGALEANGLDRNCIQMVNTPDRKVVDLLLEAEGKIDLVIPRGGEGLIRAVTAKSRIPVIKHYKGICHTYVDKAADLDMAVSIAANAKLQRPSVCNAMETLLVHSAVAEAFLPRIEAVLLEGACEIRGCAKSRAIIPEMRPATSDDWDEEYNELILSVKVVESLDEAIEHINAHGSKHSDAIITTDLKAANEFSARVDASGVFVNCSTRFNDGGEFGFGAEIGISTDKLHARGPMALPELTSYKYLVSGDGQIRE
jgi:glutamate-5-semialdehyde dehydrogenase